MTNKTTKWTATLFILCMTSMPAVAQKATTKCEVRITEPSAGQEVAARVNVRGTAKFAPGLHVWTFARRVATYRTLRVWWPQGEGTVDNSTGAWETSASIGVPEDVGYQFDVAAAVFDQKEHLQLINWLKKGMETGNYGPIEMPAAVCVAPMVTVKKTRH